MPGIGPKSAQRLVLELKDKVGPVTGVAANAPVSAGSVGWEGQVTDALTGLGYSVKQASDAVAAVAAEHPDERNVSTLLRLALRGLRP